MIQNKKIWMGVSAVFVVSAIVFVIVLGGLAIINKGGSDGGEPSGGIVAGVQLEEVGEVGGNAQAELGAGEELSVEEPPKPEPPRVPYVQEDIPSLAETFAEYFPIGAAMEPTQMSGLKSELLKKHVNMLVAENVMKPSAIQPSEGQFNWTNADRIVKFAKENGMAIRFHTLVWHSQVGQWFFRDADRKKMVDETDPDKRVMNKKLLLERLDTHVRTVVDRYKDDINSWDVVNEVIELDDPGGMRASDWYRIAGTDYIETAFRVAREAGGSDAKLYINDYGTDNPIKRDRLYTLVKALLDKGVPIDGVGHQTHIDVNGPSVELIIASMRKFAELGLDNIVTELDMSLYSWNDHSDYGANIPEDVLEKQADRYEELFEAFKEHKDILSAVVFWGITDDHSWLNGFPVTRTNAPLLFDRQYQAKSAFWAIVDPLKR